MRRQFQKTFETVEDMTIEAIEYIRKYEPVAGYWLADSGGKDSVTTKGLCDMAGVKYTAGYVRTGIDPHEIVSFIKRYHPDTLIIKPKVSFYKLVYEKCPPLMTARWCCDHIKERPGIELKSKYPIHITGIRAEESNKRAKKPRLDIHKQLKSVTIKPIYHWTEYHVWEFIEQNNLPYPKLYDEGFDRIGCVPCPFLFHKNQKKLNMHRKRWPGIFKAFERAVKTWYEKKNFKDCPHGSFEAYMEAYYRGFE